MKMVTSSSGVVMKSSADPVNSPRIQSCELNIAFTMMTIGDRIRSVWKGVDVLLVGNSLHTARWEPNRAPNVFSQQEFF